MHKRDHGSLIYPSTVFSPEDWLRFVEMPSFSSDWETHKLNDDDLRCLQISIMVGPDRFPVVPGTSGLRKIRFADSRSNRGKRGSYRIYYAYLPDYGIVVLFTLYGKNEKSDLTAAGRKATTAIMIEITELLEQGRIR